jgi:hypothetical protein
MQKIKHQPQIKSIHYYRLAVIILLLSSISFFNWDSISNNRDIQNDVYSKTFEEGLKQCQLISILPSYKEERSTNPRYRIGSNPAHRPLLIKHAILWNGDGKISKNVDIFIRDGLFVKVGTNLSVSVDHEVIDVKGSFVTPGLVDMHSHAGVDSWPSLNGNSDTNEFSSPITPQMRSIDGFNPWDKALQIINSGGTRFLH